VRLEIQPERNGSPEVPSEPPRHVVTDAATLIDDDGEPLHWNAQAPRQLGRAEAKRNHELLAQNFPWMGWLQFFWHAAPV
jgi:hypothetical protein